MNVYYKIIKNKTAYIVIPFNSPVDTAEAVRKAYNSVVKKLQQDNLQIVHERVFGSLTVMNEALQIRHEVFAAANIIEPVPVSYLDGTPAWGQGVAGINIQAINPDTTDNGIELIYDGHLPVGRQWAWDGDRYLILQNMIGKAGTLPNKQTADAIRNALRALQTNNMTFKNVSRTWFYLANVLQWYDEFNLERNNLYNQFAMMPSPEQRDLMLPASTGIGCRNAKNSTLLLNLLAIDPSESLKITQLSNPGQQDAFYYGSAFSRGTTITTKDHTWLQLSGTASIDATGATVYLDDIGSQINCTLDKISVLLAQAGATLEDLYAASIFVKKPEYITTYQKIIKERGMENFPAVCMVADVCRDNLLFEIDAEGLIG